MVSVQLDFALRTTANVKTVHLLGSWDRYAGQIPLSKTKPGSWKGTFRFQNNTIKCGGTYWYYYILDGYHVSHDPTITYTVEPTTQRKLNVLRIPANAQSSSSSKKSVPRAAPIAAPVSAPVSAIPCGRGISPSRIASPKPSRPYASRRVREFDDDCTADELVSRLEGASLSSSSTSTSSSHPSYSRSSSAYNSESESDSELSSVFSSSPASSMTSLSSAGSPRSNASSRLSKSSRSSRGGSPSSTSSSCSCQRYGITRNGQRVKLEYDCHGSICGDSESGCSDED